MKINFREMARATWRALSEAPGWPDAPFSVRLRRALPIVLPAAIAGLLVSWHLAYSAPRLEAAYAAHQPLLNLEREVAALNLAFSQQHVDELAAADAEVRRQLPRDLDEIREVLQGLVQEAERLGWEATFSAPALPETPAAVNVAVSEIPVRLRLRPAAANGEPFGSLMSLLERISTHSRRIGLMRLGISADEGKWQAVDIGLRFILPSSHAQVAQ